MTHSSRLPIDCGTPITGSTKLLGVIGYPIAHSLSPVMHNAALAHLGLNYAYLPFPIAPGDLEAAIAGLWAIGLCGFSITIPHKQAIIPFLADISTVAQAVGAVNTVWRTEQGWQGTNTDVEGFLAPLQQRSRSWPTLKAVVLGNGGAARAVVAGCGQLGLGQIHVVGRDRSKLEAFQASWRDPALVQRLSVQEWSALPALLSEATLVVNTTPVGMASHSEASPLKPEDLQRLPKGAIVYDLIYTPRPTALLKQAAAIGADCIDGLDMLIQQGAAALQQWIQQPAPIDIMRQSLLQRLSL